MEPRYIPFSLPAQVSTDDAQLRPAALKGGLTAPQTILTADGRWNHAAVYFQWNQARSTSPDDNVNWDGVVLSLWARTAYSLEVELMRFTVGAVGMQSISSGVTVRSRSALVFQANNILCDGFILKGQSANPNGSFSGGFAAMDLWAVGFDCMGGR